MCVRDVVGAMNYVRELTAFYQSLTITPLSADAQALWHLLMHINYRCGWRRTFGVAERTLASQLGFSHAAFSRARKELVLNRRLIHLPRTGRQAPIYSLISCKAVDKSVDSLGITQN